MSAIKSSVWRMANYFIALYPQVDAVKNHLSLNLAYFWLHWLQAFSIRISHIRKEVNFCKNIVSLTHLCLELLFVFADYKHS